MNLSLIVIAAAGTNKVHSLGRQRAFPKFSPFFPAKALEIYLARGGRGGGGGGAGAGVWRPLLLYVFRLIKPPYLRGFPLSYPTTAAREVFDGIRTPQHPKLGCKTFFTRISKREAKKNCTRVSLFASFFFQSGVPSEDQAGTIFSP